MKTIPFAFLVVFCVAIWEFGSTNPVALSCDSCGSECARACGTRHFRSCCFNYVKKRSNIHPLSLNQMQFEMLYQRSPYGISKLQSKNEMEQKPRPISSQISKDEAQNNEPSNDRSMKIFFKPWKEQSPIETSVNAGDYIDERHRASEPRQQAIFEI